MPNAICPLISTINGLGTLITFQSTNDDISYAFGNTSKGLSFSYFALLNIPNIIAEVSGDNVVQFQNIEGAYTAGLSDATPFPQNERINLAESLQNYMLNMESLLIRSDNYDPTIDLTVAERVFWKWMKEIGAIRYRNANAGTEASIIASNTFVEEDNGEYGNLYNKVVQYIGEIDIEGNQRSNTNAYKELYMYVPTQNGGTPFVQFVCASDNNYSPGMTIQQDGITNITYIQGQDGDPSVTPAGLRVLAFYDQEVPDGSYIYTMNSVSGEYWFKPMAGNGPYAYYTDIAFNDCTDDVITRSNLDSSGLISYIRSRLDGVCIDWNLLDYAPLYNDTTITAFADWNAQPTSSSSFTFNAIAIYYDVYDAATPDVRSTNLYGILFIDDMQVIGSTGAGIEGFLKTRPDAVLGQSGNGYGIKMNLRFDAIGGSVDVNVSVNDYNTFSMLLYADAMANISTIMSQMETVIGNNKTLSDQISNLESVILNSTNVVSVMQQINSLQNQINSLVGTDVTSGITSLITALNQKVANIINGTYPISLAGTFGVLGDGDIVVSQTSESSYVISDSSQEYNSTNQFTMYLGATQTLRQNTLNLLPKTNIYYHTNGGVGLLAINNINIYIDDTTTKWSTNQVLEIFISDSINFGTSYGIAIYTDSSNINGSGIFGTLVGVVPNPSGNAVIRVICTNATNFSFIVMPVQ